MENYSSILQFYTLDGLMFCVLSESSLLADIYLEVVYGDREID